MATFSPPCIILFLVQLEVKSRLNLEAARVLIYTHRCYAPSVHCSYYACFQFINFRLNEIGITYEKVSNDINDSKRDRSKATLHSHNYPIDLVREKLKENVSRRYASQIYNKIKLLKHHREESDYHRKFVGFNQSATALDMSEEIIDILKMKL